MSSLEETPTPVISNNTKKLSPAQEPRVIANRYKVLQRLGEGGMGKVYQSLDTILDRKVAVKVLAHFYNDDEQLKRFQQEAKLASKLNHPGIVTSYDFGVSGQRDAYYVMECVDGRDLSSYLKDNGPLDPDTFFELFAQVINAMAHAHSLDVVHRDLKPSNIMIHQEGSRLTAYVLDFGVAKGLSDSKEQSKTKTGQMIGSPKCISPEQIQAKPADSRCDIYSLGCVMYETLSGEPPFVSDTALETMKMHLNNPAPQLPSSCLEIDSLKSVNCIIQKALSKDPQDRFQSMEELGEELKSAFQSGEIESIEKQSNIPELTVNASEAKFGKIPITITVGLIILLIAIGLVATFNYFDSEQTTTEPRTSKPERTGEDSLMNTSYEAVDSLVGKPLKKSKRQFEIFRNTPDNKLSTLTHLDFQYADITDQNLKRLSKCVNLKVLNLANTKITEKGLALILNLPKLEILHLGRTRSVNYRKVKDWSGLKSIRGISLQMNNLTDTDLVGFVNLKTLGKLRLNNNSEISDFGLKILAASKSLNELDLSGTNITPAGLHVIKGSGMVVSLNHIKAFEKIDEIRLSKKLGIKILLDGLVVPQLFTGSGELEGR